MRRTTPVPVGPSAPQTARMALLTSPSMRLSFYTPAGIHSATQGTDPAIDLLSVQTSKARATGSQPGTWSATFTLRQAEDGETWYDRLDAQDGVVIEGRGDVHEPWSTVMVGFVDGVSISTAANGMSSQATVTVNGSDMCKPLVKSQADFYSGMRSTNTTLQYATARRDVSALSYPDPAASAVATLYAGVQARVFGGTAGWTGLTLPEGQAWVPTSTVALSSRPDPYAATMLAILKSYAQALPIGSTTIAGLSELLLQLTAAKTALPFTSTADPPTLMAVTLMVWLFRTFNVPWPRGKQVLGLPDLLRFLLVAPQYGITATSAALSPMQGSVWSYFLSFANEPLFELFLDTRSQAEIQGHLVPAGTVAQSSDRWDAVDGATVPGGVLWGEDKAQAVLVWRHTPFNQADWQNLVLNRLDPIEVGARQVGKGDSDVTNLYYPYPDIQSTATDPLAAMVKPLLDAASAVRYGLSPLRLPVRGLPLGSTNFAQGYQDMANDLWKWYRNNPTYASGSIQLQRGRPEIKVGQRALDAATGFEYYVEGVSHQFTVKGQMVTTLQVSRGVPSVLGPSPEVGR